MADTTKQTLYTPEGYRELENELNYLKYTKREEVKEQIAVARSYGDLSENSEYDEARNEQAKTEARIKELEELIAHAVIIDEESIDNSVVSLGSTVKVYIVEDDGIQYCRFQRSQPAGNAHFRPVPDRERTDGFQSGRNNHH